MHSLRATLSLQIGLLAAYDCLHSLTDWTYCPYLYRTAEGKSDHSHSIFAPAPYNLEAIAPSPPLSALFTSAILDSPSSRHPAIKSCTTPSSSCPHTNPPTGVHALPFFSRTRYVGTPHSPSLSASSVLVRSWSLMLCCDALAMRSAPLKPASVRREDRMEGSETLMFCSQEARSVVRVIILVSWGTVVWVWVWTYT